MNRTPLRVFMVALAVILTLSCGASPESAQKEPPDSYESRGLGPRPEPVRWVQTTGEGGATVLVYEDVVAWEHVQTPQETAVRAELDLTEQPQTHQLAYRWHQRAFQREPVKVVNSFDAEGVATTETIAGKNPFTGQEAPLTVYRLQSATLPEKYRTWVRFGDSLVVPAPKIEQSTAGGTHVVLHARATPHAIEATEYCSDLGGWRLRLHPGEELTVRLYRGTKSRAAKIKEGSTGSQLTFLDTKSEPAFEEEQTTDIYRFKAAAPGWADLKFDKMTTPTFRVRVE